MTHRQRASGEGSGDTNQGVSHMVATSSATTTITSNAINEPKVLFTTGTFKLSPKGHWTNTGVAEALGTKDEAKHRAFRRQDECRKFAIIWMFSILHHSILPHSFQYHLHYEYIRIFVDIYLCEHLSSFS